MKIFNRTILDTEALKNLLKATAKALGKRLSTDIVICINTGKWVVKGRVTGCDWVRYKNRRYRSDSCYMKITVPNRGDIIAIAENMFSVLRHEWGHVYDFQRVNNLRWKGKQDVIEAEFGFSRRQNGRRPNWRNRPEERRAEEYAEIADRGGRNINIAYEQVMAFALDFEAKSRKLPSGMSILKRKGVK